MHKNIMDEKDIMNFEFRILKSEPIHFHQNIEIMYVLEGNLKLMAGNSEYNAGPEDIIVINANKKHSYYTTEDILVGHFQIDFRQLSEMLNTNQILFWCNSTMNKNAAYEDLRVVMKEIFNQYNDKSGLGLIVLKTLYYKLLQILVENFLVRSDDKRFMNEKNPDEDRLTEIINYIHANYEKRLSLNELAEHLFLSVPYLSKYIKRNMGMNFVDYINNIRLFHAVDDLLYTDKSIMNIALDNGFANAAAFNELFKKVYNAKPSEYRHQMRVVETNESDIEKEQEIKVINERVNSYLENNMISAPLDISKENDYTILDVTKIREYKKHWSKMINVGRAGDLLRSDMQEHLILLKEEIGFQYVRFWDIFSMDLLINESNEEGIYNFEKLDKILDFLVENEILPYIEMGYKPKTLHSTISKRILTEKREIAFQSLHSFKRFITTFITHLTNRYGMEEIEKWYFEQWNGEDIEKGSESEYFFGIFNALYETIKRISPNTKVGGGGIGIQYGNGNLSRLVYTWGQQKYVPDFLSLYCYPYIRGDEDGVAYAKISTDKNFLKNQLDIASAVISDSKLKDVEIHVSEWSSTISNRNHLNDSCYKGAYIMKSIIDSMDMTDVLGYWVGSDIFAEYFDSSPILFGGCGLLSKDGIKKPSFYAYYFLNFMGKYLISAEENSIVTTNGHNSYYIACHNYRHLNYKYYLKSENEVELEKMYQLYEDNSARQLNYQLTNVKNGRYKIKTYAINGDNGSVQEEWRKMGLSNQLTKQEVDYLKRICTPFIQIKEYEVTNQILNFEVLIKAQEIQYLHISYLFE